MKLNANQEAALASLRFDGKNFARFTCSYAALYRRGLVAMTDPKNGWALTPTGRAIIDKLRPVTAITPETVSRATLSTGACRA